MQAIQHCTPTSELAEQEKWRLRPQAERYRKFYARLLRNEFASPEELGAAQSRQLSKVLQHAADQVPWYRDLFQRLRIDVPAIRTASDLPLLPVLSKADLADAATKLIARTLLPGERIHGWFSSSGTTGKPARVLHTGFSNLMFSLLVQRHQRWFRLDPQGVSATIRLASQNPPLRNGSRLPQGATLRMPRWRYSGSFFETGPSFYFNIENPVEEQISWLQRVQPKHLVTYSESLEHLGFACEGHWPVPGIERLQAISEQLTPSMRLFIERTLGAPVFQSYGLNEIGLVAIACEAGRYHWHVEHCIVEIVDADGQPCAAGERGRIVVSALRNSAMPLLRYDTGDMAEAVSGACPCGRTLPAFGNISGRYSRIAFLPADTLTKVGAIRTILEQMPFELARNLRQFQVHQFRDDRFELRILAKGPMAEGFFQHVLTAWKNSPVRGATPLEIRQVDAIQRSPGGKFQDFTSDHMPDADRQS